MDLAPPGGRLQNNTSPDVQVADGTWSCFSGDSLKFCLNCWADVQKFPLRMKDNDLLVTELYRDPTEDAITALSVYLTPKTSRCSHCPPRQRE